MINHTPMLYRLGMDYDDKVGAGYLGLVKAADSFDASVGRFSTYACRAIGNEIIREYLRGQLIHISDSMFWENNRIRALAIERNVPISEILPEYGISETEWVQRNPEIMNSEDAEFADVGYPDASEEKDWTLPIYSSILKQEICTLLSSASGNDETIIRLASGIEGIRMTYDEIAKKIGAPRSYISSRIKMVRKRLSRSPRLKAWVSA